MMNSFAHHPDLAQAFFSFNGHMLYGTTLSVRQRELLVLRVAAVRQSQYLWAHHIVYQDEASLTDYEISAIAFGPGAPFLEPLDQALLCSVDELIRNGTISDENWAVLAAKLTTQQILDVIFTIGCYDIVAWTSDTLELDLDIDPPGGGPAPPNGH
jgi:alkylhydroperoxidase family enzyme